MLLDSPDLRAKLGRESGRKTWLGRGGLAEPRTTPELLACPGTTLTGVAYTTYSQRIPGIARSGDQFVVVWQGAGPAEGRNIFGRRLSPGLIFYDGFESGDLSARSSSQP